MLAANSRKKELVDYLNLARLVKPDGGHHVGQRLLVGGRGGNHFDSLFGDKFGRPDMGLGLKKIGEMNEMDENEQRTNADVRICFVDNNTTFFWAKAERVPILRKKLTECLRFRTSTFYFVCIISPPISIYITSNLNLSCHVLASTRPP